MEKIAILGASYLQLPLIKKAKQMGLETHVFAWACGDVGEKEADYFYPISVIEKDEILKQCKKIGISGITSIASDLAMLTVNYVAHHLGLIGNSLKSTELSTDKYKMRLAFKINDDPSPQSILVEHASECEGINYPVIVKPLDRSGSRGVTKLNSFEGLENAIEWAKNQGFVKKALVEEFAEGQEYSIEFISWKGKHTYLATTKKFVTGPPRFIETGHLEPGFIPNIENVISHALNSLGIKYGASHSEVKVDNDGNIKIIEIGARMGGDFIGSHMVELSTGYDYVKGVIEVALGIEPIIEKTLNNASAVRYMFSKRDIVECKNIPIKYKIHEEVFSNQECDVLDSSMRLGFCLLKSDKADDLLPYLPDYCKD